jgi:hypothetical protein
VPPEPEQVLQQVDDLQHRWKYLLTDQPGTRYMISREPVGQAAAAERIEQRYPGRVQEVWR